MMNNVRKKVLVLFGGRSAEHDISIITGVLTLNAMDKELYEPIPCYVTEAGFFTGEELFDIGFYKGRTTDGLARIVPLVEQGKIHILKGKRVKELCEIYCAINCMHGLNGEDGCVAGLMRLCSIPFASPDMLCSSVCIDKAATKTFLQGMGVATLPCKVVKRKGYFQNRGLIISLTEKQIGYPCIVKPARLGSSVGIKRAENKDELVRAIEYALRFDAKIIIERALEDFVEINCAAYKTGGRVVVSECERPMASGKLLSFEDKYNSGSKRTLTREFPARIDEGTRAKIQEITSAVYRKLFAVGIIRIDFLVSNGEVYLNEVNTVPGSLALYLFKNRVSDYAGLLNELIEEGVAAHREFKNGTFDYPTDVLSGVGSKNSGVKRSTN